MNLVIVESPAKAKTINKYLGDNYTVLASYGHIRDLPSKNGSVDPDHNFKMEWEVDSFSKKYLKEITDVAKESSKIILATDPDREGEAIAWHVKEYLDEKKLLKDKEIERVVFNEITKKAVIHGIENPRQIEPLLWMPTWQEELLITWLVLTFLQYFGLNYLGQNQLEEFSL